MAELLDSIATFLSSEDAKRQISTSDIYSKNLSTFDLQAKIQSLSQQLCERDYLENSTLYVRNWTKSEIQYLERELDWINCRLNQLSPNFQLPKNLLFVKTTGQEEGGARGYTRENSIYLNQNHLSRELLLHEIFHIISRHNETLASKAYAILGFNPCNDIRFLNPLRISNPDAPHLRHYLNIKTLHGSEDVAFVMMAKPPYAGGSFFPHIEKRLLVLDRTGKDRTVKMVKGNPSFLNFSDAIDLYEHIGRNTGYNIHQEEVSAVHFEYLIAKRKGLAHPEKIEKLKTLLFD